MNIQDYSLEKYRALLGIVFQDFKLLAYSIEENLTRGIASDQVRMASCLEEAGLSKDIAQLPKGVSTNLYKVFDQGDIELSGGILLSLPYKIVR